MRSGDMALQAPWVGHGAEDLPFADSDPCELAGVCGACGAALYEGDLFYDFGEEVSCYGCIHDYLDRRGYCRG